MRTKLTTFLLLFGLLIMPAQSAFAAPHRVVRADVTDNQVTFSFPKHSHIFSHTERRCHHHFGDFGIRQCTTDLW